MKIIAYNGSPRVNGKTAKVMKKMLEGAASKGAETKMINLIKSNIEHCRGCEGCYHKEPELLIGKCCIKDEMHEMLEEYIEADGYILGSPVYDMCSTALMKKFVERKIALTYRPKEDYAKLGSSRCPADFKKMAILVATANCSDEYEEIMGEPCFEVMNAHLMIEQVWVTDKFYLGSVETITKEEFEIELEKAYKLGIKLVEEIEAAQS